METLNTTIGMINHQKWCHKCGGFVEGIFAGNPRSCRCDPKADHIKELEAEVERLRKQLQQAVDIAEEFWNNQKQAITVYHQELADELDQLKATINQDNK